jgi:alanyl-tRNA synthetase
MLDSKKLKTLYLEFFREKNHKIIPSAPLVPLHDKSVLFTTAGMHPLVPHLLGLEHPSGKRLVNVQKCLRTDDIFEIGDDSHLTFFEMLGNWSLGDYFKKESITWSFEFLTSPDWLDLDKNKLSVTVFAGDRDAGRDEESADIWRSIGIPELRIFYLPKEDNWWGPVSTTGPCGPDTEIFYDTGKVPSGPDCRPGCKCGKYFEIWNNVFMEYNKTAEGKYEPLKQKNVDTGMGVERTTSCLNGMKSVYEIDTFAPLILKIHEIAGDLLLINEDPGKERSRRVIADHAKAATFIMAENVSPSNVARGYILRRLLRRAVRHGKILGIEKEFVSELAKVVIEFYKSEYPILEQNSEFILNETIKEEERFRTTLDRGLRKFGRLSDEKGKIDGKDAFLLFQSFGFPIEITKELADEKGISVDTKAFEVEFAKHQHVSRLGAEKMFKAVDHIG